jgi:hypothetical protein
MRATDLPGHDPRRERAAGDPSRRTGWNKRLALSHLLSRARLTEGFDEPGGNLLDFQERLGSLFFTKDYPLLQYVAWADTSGLFEFVHQNAPVRLSDVVTGTVLNEAGADALLGILCAVKLATRSPDGFYRLTANAIEFCRRDSPYCLVDQVTSKQKPVPRTYLHRSRESARVYLRQRILACLPKMRYGSRLRLRNQHVRNLPASAAAVKSGEFANVRCIVDVAGGSGPFVIPLALSNSKARIILAELPQALRNIAPFLSEHGVADRIELLAMNAFEHPWRLPTCDGIFVGNFLHGFDDATCYTVVQEAFRSLTPGGHIWIHEMLWNDNKDGPLFTALWNAAIRNGPGRQRTFQEFVRLLEPAGFVDAQVRPTAGAFRLVRARVP